MLSQALRYFLSLLQRGVCFRLRRSGGGFGCGGVLPLGIGGGLFLFDDSFGGEALFALGDPELDLRGCGEGGGAAFVFEVESAEWRSVAEGQEIERYQAYCCC